MAQKPAKKTEKKKFENVVKQHGVQNQRRRCDNIKIADNFPVIMEDTNYLNQEDHESQARWTERQPLLDTCKSVEDHQRHCLRNQKYMTDHLQRNYNQAVVTS